MVPGKDRRNAAAKNVANGPGPSGSGNGGSSGVDFVAGGNLGPVIWLGMNLINFKPFLAI